MNLEFIQGLWDKDSVIDNELLHSESTKTPALHAKYYKIFTNILTLQKAQETQYKILKKEKWIYYSGKACLLYTSPSPRDDELSRMPSSA